MIWDHKVCPLLRRCPLMEVLSIFPLLPTSPFPLFTNSGSKVSYQLLIFDPRKRTLKDRIPMEDIVTIRASCDCFFQIFLSSGKILQFRAENMESQAYWMARIKVGLGRGETIGNVSPAHPPPPPPPPPFWCFREMTCVLFANLHSSTGLY